MGINDLVNKEFIELAQKRNVDVYIIIHKYYDIRNIVAKAYKNPTSSQEKEIDERTKNRLHQWIEAYTNRKH